MMDWKRNCIDKGINWLVIQNIWDDIESKMNRILTPDLSAPKSIWSKPLSVSKCNEILSFKSQSPSVF